MRAGRNVPTYHFERTYQWNYENGPDFSEGFPEISEEPSCRCLGFSLNSPIGIPAGILLNSRWVATYARLGFDILTYKTVRTRPRPAYPLPNWVFLDCKSQLQPGYTQPLTAYPMPNRSLDQLTSAICFGMPSASPEIWRKDVTVAKASLKPGQVLIVSVVGTPGDPPDIKALAADYALCAKWAVEAGADIVEANLSCPNVSTMEGQIYQNREATFLIAQGIRGTIPAKIPLLLKIGTLPNSNGYAEFLQMTGPPANGIVLVNSIIRRVHNRDGSPTFGQERETAGVVGWAVRNQCLDQTRMILAARQAVGSSQVILSAGGILSEEASASYLDAGSDAILLGSAPVFDPYLAMKIKKRIASKSA